MNTKVKTIISIIVFAVFMITAYLAYGKIKEGYDADANKGSDSISTQDYGTIDAADFTVTDADGNKVRLSDFKGKPVVLNFWASWCGPCKSEMPHFNEVYGEYKDKVVFLMVDLVDGQRETVQTGKKFIRDNVYTFTAYYDTEQDAAYAFGITSIPSTYFINSEGKIVKFKNIYGRIVAGYQGAIDKNTLISGIKMILS